MAVRRSYMPKSYTGIATTKDSQPVKNQNVSTILWTNALMRGTARYSVSGAIVSNAAVLIWTGAIGSIGNAYAITFTDANGRYAVAVKTGATLGLKIYS